MLNGELENLVESLPAVVPAYGVSLLVTNMIVGGNQDTNRVGIISTA